MRILKVTKDGVEVVEINGSLESMQDIVGGYIEATYPWDDPAALVCNEEGKINGLYDNRMMCCDNIPYDIICGDFFICGVGDEDFCSLSDEQIKKYSKMFKNYLVNI